LPKDLAAFTRFVKTHNLTPQLLEAVAAVNDTMAQHVKQGTFTNLHTLAPQHRWIQDS
jgi:UDP-glucose 6-dehydrogenase